MKISPHEIKMFYSSRWNQLTFRIPVGYRTWIYRRATELFSSLPEKRILDYAEKARQLVKMWK